MIFIGAFGRDRQIAFSNDGHFAEVLGILFPLFIGRVSPIPSAAHKEADRLALFTANSERSGLAESDRGIEVELLIESFKTCIDAFRPDLGTHGPIAVAAHVDVGRAAQVHGGAFVGNTRDFRSHIVVDSGDREHIFIVAHTSHRDVERRVFGREDLAVGPSLKPHGFVRIGVVRVVIRALVRAREHINLDSRPVHVERTVIFNRDAADRMRIVAVSMSRDRGRLGIEIESCDLFKGAPG